MTLFKARFPLPSFSPLEDVYIGTIHGALYVGCHLTSFVPGLGEVMVKLVAHSNRHINWLRELRDQERRAK